MNDEANTDISTEELSERREHRRNPRFFCEGFAEALILDPESLFRGEILNISLGGCFIRTRARLKVERLSRVELRFRLNNLAYRANAQVMDIQPGKGMGLEFQFDGAKPEGWLLDLIDTLNQAAAQKKS